MARRGTPPDVRRKYDLAQNGTDQDLGLEVLRELCFDSENHDYLMYLLVRGLVPASLVAEHLQLDDDDGVFAPHRSVIATNAELSEAQWMRLAGDEYREVVEAVVEAVEYREVPASALHEAQRALREDFGGDDWGSPPGDGGLMPQWHWPFVVPVLQQWPTRSDRISIALVDDDGDSFHGELVSPGPSAQSGMEALVAASSRLRSARLRSRPGALVWWWPMGGDTSFVGGGVATVDGQAMCRFNVRRGAGGVSWNVDDDVGEWDDAEIAMYQRITDAYRGQDS